MHVHQAIYYLLQSSSYETAPSSNKKQTQTLMGTEQKAGKTKKNQCCHGDSPTLYALFFSFILLIPPL